MEDLLEELLRRNNIPIQQDKFYRQFSGINTSEINKANFEHLIAKVWDLVQKNIISKNILYLSLILHRNDDLLQKCITWDDSILEINFKDPCILFDYTVYAKRHWFYHLFKSGDLVVKDALPNSVYQKFMCLQAISITNESDENINKLLEHTIKECDTSGIDKFWIYYLKEINHILKILEFCKNRNPYLNDFEFLNYASQNSVLKVCSEYLNFYTEHIELERFLIELNESPNPHEENVSIQALILASYSVIAELLKLIIHYDNTDKHINVIEIIRDVQLKLLNITDNSMQIELLQSIFAFLFIKQNEICCFKDSDKQQSYESYICNEKEIQLILFALKSLIEELQFKKIHENDVSNLPKINDLHKMVTDATWRFELIANVVDKSKCGHNLLHYMLAEPECLINICLKKNDFIRASQVLQVCI